MPTTTLDISTLNFEHCEQEQIHLPEAIQPYGYFIAFDKTNRKISIVSENVRDILQAGLNLIGTDFYSLLSLGDDVQEFITETIELAEAENVRLPIQIALDRDFLASDKIEGNYHAVVYVSGGHVIFELEPAAQFRQTYSTLRNVKLYTASIAPKFRLIKTLDEMAQEIVSTIHKITHMDRVVLYRFLEDYTGKVIAESKVEEVESYLDVYYPASDIPPQARDLYTVNWARLIPDVDYVPSPLYPPAQEGKREPIDLTQSILRSMSPIHRQYVRNQGLKSSFSLSLVTHGKLWGLISCHHREPIYLGQDVRLQCENLSQLFSWHLYAKEEEIFIKKRLSAEQSVNNLLSRISPDKRIAEIFQDRKDEVLGLMGADGFVFKSELEQFSIGDVPPWEELDKLPLPAMGGNNEHLLIDQLSDFISLPKGSDITGALVLPLSDTGNTYTGWFRKSTDQIQKWAGVEREQSLNEPKRDRLMPRASFKIHVRHITDQCIPFSQNDIELGQRFNRIFLSHVLEVQNNLNNTLMQLKENDKYRNEFLATLAHELRNPLAPISAGISLLDDPQGDASKQQIVATIRRRTEYMSKLIDDLMDVSRVTQDKISLRNAPLQLEQVIGDSIELSEKLIADRNHTLELALSDEYSYVLGDRVRLEQIFSNVLNNAARYTAPGGKIQVWTEKDSASVKIFIKDNGRGIPRSEIDSIFTMFKQIRSNKTESEGGLGIGLTLAKKLTALHGGSIGIQSDGEGQGTLVTIILPTIEQSFHEPVSDEPKNNKATDATGIAKILIVDDLEDILAVYKMVYEELGHQVETASHWQAAITIFNEFKPDIVWLDIGMPVMDGFELCKQLSNLPNAANTVFLSQSGWGTNEDIKKAKEAGFREHYVKPLTIEDLKGAVAKYFNRPA